MLIRSFRTQLTALYLAFFSLLFVLFSIFLYGELSRSLVGRLDDTLAAEADTAAVLFPDELQEMKGDAPAAAREVIGELKVHGDFVIIREGSRVLAGSSQSAPDPRGRSTTRTVEAGGHTYEIVVSASLAWLHAELAVVRRAIFIALPLILALAGLGGYALATRSLRPLGGMAEQARRITGSNLETRIEIDNAAEELAVLVTSFNELLSRLDQSFDTMRRFVADASHEAAHGVEGLIEAREQLVEGGDEHGEFLGGIVDFDARFQIAAGDAARLFRHPAQRAQAARGECVSAQPGEREDEGQGDENGAADHGQFGVEPSERRRDHDFVGVPAGFDCARGAAAARLRRGLRAAGENAAALPDDHKIAVHFQFADHFARGRRRIAFHLLEFVGEEHGGRVGLRSERVVQAAHEGSRELAIQKDAEEDEQQREERQVQRRELRAKAADQHWAPGVLGTRLSLVGRPGRGTLWVRPIVDRPTAAFAAGRR